MSYYPQNVLNKEKNEKQWCRRLKQTFISYQSKAPNNCSLIYFQLISRYLFGVYFVSEVEICSGSNSSSTGHKYRLAGVINTKVFLSSKTSSASEQQHGKVKGSSFQPDEHISRCCWPALSWKPARQRPAGLFQAPGAHEPPTTGHVAGNQSSFNG